MSRYHGKLKTKYDRMLLGIHFANALSSHFLKMRREGVAINKPEYTSKFQFPTDHCQMTWAKLDLSRSMQELHVDVNTLSHEMEQRTTSASQKMHPCPHVMSMEILELLTANFLKDITAKLSTGCVGSTLRVEAFTNLIGILASEWKDLFSVSKSSAVLGHCQNSHAHPHVPT